MHIKWNGQNILNNTQIHAINKQLAPVIRVIIFKTNVSYAKKDFVDMAHCNSVYAWLDDVDIANKAFPDEIQFKGCSSVYMVTDHSGQRYMFMSLQHTKHSTGSYYSEINANFCSIIQLTVLFPLTVRFVWRRIIMFILLVRRDCT